VINQYLRNEWKRYLRIWLFIPLTLFIGVGIFLFFTVNIFTPPPDRPIEWVGKILANIAVIFCLLIFPIFLIYKYHHRKTFTEIAYYKVDDCGFIFITPGFVKRVIEFENIRGITCPNPKETPLLERSIWEVVAYEYNGYIITSILDIKTSYRMLVYYLRKIRQNPDKFKCVIFTTSGPDEIEASEALKKSIKNPEVWDKYLEEYWATHNRYYWLNTPLERILEDLHCPYTLEELENPSEDEYVEIDESKIREDVC